MKRRSWWRPAEGNLETVRALLEGGADPNAKEKNGGQTALMWAIAERHSAVTEELVQYSADVNARSKGGSTALMFAARRRYGVRPHPAQRRCGPECRRCRTGAGRP